MGSPFRGTGLLSLAEVLAAEPAAAARGVSKVARSPRGFVRAYEEAGGLLGSMGLESTTHQPWAERRAGFIRRHRAQGRDEGWWESSARGERPTRRHLALMQWAYTPTPKKTRAWLQQLRRERNPVSSPQEPQMIPPLNEHPKLMSNTFYAFQGMTVRPTKVDALGARSLDEAEVVLEDDRGDPAGVAPLDEWLRTAKTVSVPHRQRNPSPQRRKTGEVVESVGHFLVQQGQLLQGDGPVDADNIVGFLRRVLPLIEKMEGAPQEALESRGNVVAFPGGKRATAPEAPAGEQLTPHVRLIDVTQDIQGDWSGKLELGDRTANVYSYRYRGSFPTKEDLLKRARARAREYELAYTYAEPVFVTKKLGMPSSAKTNARGVTIQRYVFIDNRDTPNQVGKLGDPYELKVEHSPGGVFDIGFWRMESDEERGYMHSFPYKGYKTIGGAERAIIKWLQRAYPEFAAQLPRKGPVAPKALSGKKLDDLAHELAADADGMMTLGQMKAYILSQPVEWQLANYEARIGTLQP